jgi:DnaK suppressor protein
MSDKSKYSQQELKEFEDLILQKLKLAKEELKTLMGSINHSTDETTDGSYGGIKTIEDGAETAEREQMNHLAARQQKFINNLANALIRIKNGTYGICIDTGKLIKKERLMSVPHTMHSIEAKLKKS